MEKKLSSVWEDTFRNTAYIAVLPELSTPCHLSCFQSEDQMF